MIHVRDAAEITTRFQLAATFVLDSRMLQSIVFCQASSKDFSQMKLRVLGSYFCRK